MPDSLLFIKVLLHPKRFIVIKIAEPLGIGQRVREMVELVGVSLASCKRLGSVLWWAQFLAGD